MATALNLAEGQRARRKLLLTVAEWTESSGGTPKREILGKRVTDSSIELNPQIETSTDILGITYTDVEKTEPQQTLDPSYIIGGSDLAAYMTDAMISNDIDKWNGAFTIYIITAFVGDSTNGYQCARHTGCSIIPTAMGGEAYIGMPLEVHFSNNLTMGTVDSISTNFEFTPVP